VVSFNLQLTTYHLQLTMKLITTIDEMKEYSREAHRQGKTIGFVPTMGYLHEGHMSLVKAAREQCDVVVISIFVNPAQFGPGEDLDRYPRDIERDKRVSEGCGVDVVFFPSVEDMYPDRYSTYVELTGAFTDTMCGSSRPGHFRGVTTVVSKLFNIISPNVSYFGQKDAQQAIVIKRMVDDLNMDTEIRVMPIVREKDGLAMSSRNACLSEEERKKAPNIFRSLEQAEGFIAAGESSADKVREEMKKILGESGGLKIDYLEIVDADDLSPVKAIGGNTLIAVAAFIGRTRLIDNVLIRR